MAEEVARLYGYNKIESTLLRGETTLGMKTPKQKMKDQVQDALASQGYFEVMTYSFTSPKHLAATGADPQKAIALQNPLGEENSVMRTNMLSFRFGNFSAKLCPPQRKR